MQGMCMPFLLQTPSALIWRRNDVLGHLLVQRADSVLITEVSRVLNSVMLYQQLISNVQWPLPHYNGSKLLILLQLKSAPGKACYIAAFSFIVLFINRLISHVRLSPRYGREMFSRTASELLRLSHGNLSHASLPNRLSVQDRSIMESAMSRVVYCSLLRNILLTGSQLCPLRSWLFIIIGIDTCSLVKNQRTVDK